MIDLRRKAARRQEDTVGQQRPEGKLCVAGHHEEVHGMMNTDLIETAELEDLIGQISQCLYSGDEHHES